MDSTVTFPKITKRFDVQRELVQEEAEVFSLVSGAWSQRGYTNVHLQKIEADEFAVVLRVVWSQVAPKRLVAEHSVKNRCKIAGQRIGEPIG